MEKSEMLDNVKRILKQFIVCADSVCNGQKFDDFEVCSVLHGIDEALDKGFGDLFKEDEGYYKYLYIDLNNSADKLRKFVSDNIKDADFFKEVLTNLTYVDEQISFMHRICNGESSISDDAIVRYSNAFNKMVDGVREIKELMNDYNVDLSFYVDRVCNARLLLDNYMKDKGIV